MNVKNLDKFLDDIDEEKVVDWEIQTDCHRKIEKLKLHKETILTEKEYTEEVQMTLENNPRHLTRSHRRDVNPEKQWEVPSREIASKRMDEEMMKNTPFIPENIKKALSMMERLEYPIYDGSYYYKNGEKVRA